MRYLFGLAIVVVVITVYAVVDCAMLPNNRVRGLSKPTWLVVILLLPVAGFVLWFVIGRGRADADGARRTAPDDDPAFLGSLGRDANQDERIRQLEEELAALDSDEPATPKQPPATAQDAAPDAGAPRPDDSADHGADHGADNKDG